MAVIAEIADLVDQTLFVDTHEHLMEESERVEALKNPTKSRVTNDIGMFFCHYSDSDLLVAGMDPKELEKLRDPQVAPRDKWRAVAPFYERSRHTGYLLNVRESLQALYGEEDINEANCERISEKVEKLVRPGYYWHVLKTVSRIEYTQVNSLDTVVFRDTDDPALLSQDISFVRLSTDLNVAEVERVVGREAKSLADWHAIIDWCYAEYGPRAIAVKNQSAYGRRLNYENVSSEVAAPIFERMIRKDGGRMSREERKPLEDHLFHYCVEKSTEYNLPVKLHTGYYAGQGGMPLERVRQNAGDLCPVLKAHRDTKFVLMHIDYPYQDEAIALAKHYPNAYIDMCWAWIINPAAAVRFVKEFVMAAPACKLLTFGGDYMPVEMVPGHARIARRGIAQALSELVEEKWVAMADVEALVERLMRGNAHEIFDFEGTLAKWNKPAKPAR